MTPNSPRWLSIISICLIAILCLGYLGVLNQAFSDSSASFDLWPLPFVGVIGAVIANASGTGGGVVFLPVFNVLNDSGQVALSQVNILAASFLIQCFGMSMGALVWSRNLYTQKGSNLSISTNSFWSTIAYILALSLPVMLFAQYRLTFNADQILFAFKLFSIALGTLLVITTLMSGNRSNRKLKENISKVDLALLIAIAPLGGLANALFSVGLGEIIALTLFLRGYCIVTSSGIAVIISCVSVLVGAPFHIIEGNVPWSVLAFTAPGALLGGFIARRIALALGAYRLKLAAGGWIAFSGVALLLFKLS